MDDCDDVTNSLDDWMNFTSSEEGVFVPELASDDIGSKRRVRNMCDTFNFFSFNDGREMMCMCRESQYESILNGNWMMV